MIKLTDDSVGKTYLDKQGREYVCMKKVTPCCSMQHYLLLDMQGISQYPYSSAGVRLDHKLKPVLDSSTNLIKELENAEND